uniref:Pyridoxal-phosphate dependent enzyme n=1 Tax=Ignisphaera aggregans TaxID=334771 RepID=A0A7C5TJI0_9CREN
MHLVKADEIVCEYDIGLEEFLKIASDILRNGGIDKTIVINSNGKVIENNNLCIVLKKLGVKYIPISYYVTEYIFIPLETLRFFDDIDPNKYRVFKDSEELLYRNWPTPLVRLKKSSIDDKVAWAKLEGFNPWSMSVKDRIGWYMYRKAIEKYGAKGPHLLVESTSTNTGLAIASMCSIYGSKLRAYIPSTVSVTGELLLKIFGVDVIRSPKPLTVDLIDEVEDVARREDAVHLNQFYNDANLEVHLRYTAKELELQIREAGIVPKAIFGGLGTSGHMSAISIYFKNRFRGVKIYGVVPKLGTAIQGIRRIESGMKWIHHVEIDEVIEVSPDDAVKGVLDVVRSDGIFIGLSSGAVYHAYRKMAIDGKLDKGDYILIFPDIGFKYVEQISKYI